MNNVDPDSILMKMILKACSCYLYLACTRMLKYSSLHNKPNKIIYPTDQINNIQLSPDK